MLVINLKNIILTCVFVGGMSLDAASPAMHTDSGHDDEHCLVATLQPEDFLKSLVRINLAKQEHVAVAKTQLDQRITALDPATDDRFSRREDLYAWQEFFIKNRI